MFTWFLLTVYPCIGICVLEEVISSSRLYTSLLLHGKSFYQSVQLGVLGRSSDSISEQARLDVEVSSWGRPLSCSLISGW